MFAHYLTGDWIYSVVLGSLGSALGTFFTTLFLTILGIGSTNGE
jgi:hypothetical protein